MFRTFGEKLKDIEAFYENKDYNNVVVETAKLMEQALGYLFKNFHRTLETPKERLKFLDFEKENDEKYSSFLKKPTIGVALGFYNTLLKHFPDHKWLKPELKSAINQVNVIRNAQVHAGKVEVTDSEAGEVIDAAEMFLKGTEIFDLPVEDVGFPLKYYLVYTSIQDKFEKGETESDFKKIISDSSKLIPDLLNSVFNKVYPFLPIADKEKLNQLHPKTLDAKSKEISLKYFIEIFEEIKLFDQIENGENLKRSLLIISEEDKDVHSRRETRHHVSILEIIFNFIHNKKLDHFLEYADVVKKKYLEDNQINETDRIILTDRAKELEISHQVAGRIEDTVVRTIEKELILFQTLHEEKVKEEKVRVGREEKEVTEKKGIQIKKSILFPVLGASVVIMALIIYLVLPKSEFTAYEREYFCGGMEKVTEKSKKARTLTNTKAHHYYIYTSYFNNDQILPDEIVNEYQELYKKNHDSPEANFYLGYAYYWAYNNYHEEELLDSAWILIQNALDMGLQDLYVDIAKHIMVEDLGIVPLIIETAENLVKDYPDNPRAWSFAAGAYLQSLYDTVKAIEYYEKTLEVYPDYIMALRALAEIYIDQHEFELAEEKLNQALNINPDFGDLAYRFLELYIESGRINEADDFLNGIIKRYDLSHVNYYRALASIYLQQCDTIDGLDFIETALEKFPVDYNLMNSLDELRSIMRIDQEEIFDDKTQKIGWIENFNEALSIAEKENKPILAEFCNHKNNYSQRTLKRNIYSDASVQDYLKNFIPVRIYAMTDRDIFHRYEIEYPGHDLKLIAPDGVKIEDLQDYFYYEYPSVFIADLKEGLQKFSRYVLGKSLNTENFTEVSNLEDAKLISRAKKYPIMVVVHSENLEFSKKLVNETLQHPLFQAEFNNLVYLLIDQERNPVFTDNWDIRIFPTVLYLNEYGEIIHWFYGYKTPEMLAEITRKVKESHLKKEKYVPEINWLFNFEEAMATALTEQKNIFMCSTYLLEDTSLVKDPQVINELKKYVCLSIEDTYNKDLVSEYGYIGSYSGFILDQSGNELFKEISLYDKERIMKFLDLKDKVKLVTSLGSEKYETYKNNLELAEEMRYSMPRSAIKIFIELLNTTPDNIEIVQKLGRQYMLIKNPEEAINYFHKEIEITTEYSEELLDNMINAYLQLQDDKDLMVWFDHQIEKEQNDSILSLLYRKYSELSEILLDSAKALEYALHAVQSNSKDYQAYVQYGKLLYYSGNYAEAKRYLSRATILDKEDPSVYLYLALIADHLDEIDEKNRNFELALERNPYAARRVTSYYFIRPKYYMYPGYIALDERSYRDAIRIAPKEIDIKSDFATLLGIWKKDLDYALELINECIDQEPEEWYYLDTKAWILYQMGKYSEAEETINLFMQNYPERYIERAIGSLYHIGKIKIATGDTIEGYDYLQKTLKFREVEPYEDFMVEDVKSILASQK